jgi:hypothetical protein
MLSLPFGKRIRHFYLLTKVQHHFQTVQGWKPKKSRNQYFSSVSEIYVQLVVVRVTNLQYLL